MENLAAKFDSIPEDLETKFKRKLEQFSALAATQGLEIAPYSVMTWRKFRTLSGALQKQAYESFSAYNDLCSAVHESGIALNDDRAVAWWAVQKFNLRPCSDFFDKLSKDHVVELYDRNSVQMYRNWAFFQISSYSMGDLFVYSWPDLYRRDPKVMENLLHYAKLVLSGDYKSTIPCESPRHFAIELMSTDQNVLDMQLDYVSPLFDGAGEIVAYFAVSSVKKIGRQAAEATDRAAVLSLV